MTLRTSYSTHNTCLSHPLATSHEHRPLIATQGHTSTGVAGSDVMDAYLAGGVDRSAAVQASPPPPPPPPPTTSTSTTSRSTAQAQPSERPPAGTATVLGAGVGRNQKTSPVWQHFSEFEPPVEKKNVKCTVVTKLPASGRLPARKPQPGKLSTYNRADLPARKRKHIFTVA